MEAHTNLTFTNPHHVSMNRDYLFMQFEHKLIQLKWNFFKFTGLSAVKFAGVAFFPTMSILLIEGNGLKLFLRTKKVEFWSPRKAQAEEIETPHLQPKFSPSKSILLCFNV